MKEKMNSSNLLVARTFVSVINQRQTLSFLSPTERERMQQQTKILNFFKPSSPKTQTPPQLSDQIDTWQFAADADPNSLVTYTRRSSVSDRERELDDRSNRSAIDSSNPIPGSKISASKILNKKRSYAQYHLELGQSDFLLHSCSVCGLMYARGDDSDEKVHKAFHKDYYEGIQFKGWRNERVVSKPGSSRDRILLVLNDDPPAHKQKVNQVTRMMEKELRFSENRLIHKLCKVYLFISSSKVIGCLVAEPIRTAHRVIFGPSLRSNKGLKLADNDSKRLMTTVLQFGQFNFQREVAKREHTSNSQRVNEWDSGALLCEEEALPAICGFRAVWVAPAKRRKRVASDLLNAARESFSDGRVLEISQCAFSPPTSYGKALASSYSGSEPFMIYREDDI